MLRQGMMLLIDGGRARGGFTYVDNVAQAMMDAAASSKAVGRAYNITDGTGVTWRDYTNALADALGYRRPRFSLPFPIAMALGASMEMPFALLKLAGRPLLTRHAVYLLARDQEYPAARAREDFGFAPQVSFAEGIARSAAWVRRRGLSQSVSAAWIGTGSDGKEPKKSPSTATFVLAIWSGHIAQQLVAAYAHGLPSIDREEYGWPAGAEHGVPGASLLRPERRPMPQPSLLR